MKNFLAYTLRRLGTDHVDIYAPARSSPISRSRRRSARSPRWWTPATCATSDCPKWGPRPCAARMPCTRSQTCRSSTRSSRAGSRTRSCPPAASSGSASPPTASSPAASSPATGRGSGPKLDRTTSGPPPPLLGENLERNLALVETLRGCRREKDATVAQIAIAWALSRGDDVVPLVGAARASAREALARSTSSSRRRPGEDRGGDPADAVAGERYQAEQMAILDSERSVLVATETLTPERILEASEEVLRRFGPPRRTSSTSPARSVSATAASTGTSRARPRSATRLPSAGSPASPRLSRSPAVRPCERRLGRWLDLLVRSKKGSARNQGYRALTPRRRKREGDAGANTKDRGHRRGRRGGGDGEGGRVGSGAGSVARSPFPPPTPPPPPGASRVSAPSTRR